MYIFEKDVSMDDPKPAWEYDAKKGYCSNQHEFRM